MYNSKKTKWIGEKLLYNWKHACGPTNVMVDHPPRF